MCAVHIYFIYIVNNVMGTIESGGGGGGGREESWLRS